MAYEIDRLLTLLRISPKNVAILGAWQGVEVPMLIRLGSQRIHLFEAEREALSILRKSFEQIDIVRIHEGAVSSASGIQLTLNVLNHASSSVLTPNMSSLSRILPDFEFQEGQVVSSVTVDEVLAPFVAEWELDSAENFFIVDLQGYELEALKGSTTILGKTQFIICEISKEILYDGQCSITELDNFLKTLGFARYSTRLYHKQNHGDALFHKVKKMTFQKFIRLKLGDLHWAVSQRRPEWFPSISKLPVGQVVQNFLYGKPR